MKHFIFNKFSVIIAILLVIVLFSSQTYSKNKLGDFFAVSNGEINTIAGIPPFTGDSNKATEATLYTPVSVAFDSKGNIYIADLLNFRIRRVDAQTKIISSIAGTGSPIFSGDGGLATKAGLVVNDIAIDSMGNIFIADSSNNRIRKIDASTGIINTVAGGGNIFDGKDLDATQIRLSSPSGVAVDSTGNIYICDTRRSRVCKVDSVTKKITTIAGNNFGFSGDGDLAEDANFRFPTGIEVDVQGNIFIADPLNNRIRKIDNKTKIINSLPISLRNPQDVAINKNGDVLIADSGNQQIKLLSSTGVISLVAGSNSNPFGGFSGDGGVATSAMLSFPSSIALDPTDEKGSLFIADSNNDRIRKVDLAEKIITTVVGKSRFGFSGDGDLATKAMLAGPRGLAIDKIGNIFIVDSINNRIRKIDKDGKITTVAGNGKREFSGDGNLAIEAGLNFPSAIALDSTGNIFIADMFNSRIRKVDVVTKTISTVAGNGQTSFNIDTTIATDSALPFPMSVSVDSKDNLLILSQGRICKMDALGKIVRVAGNEKQDFGGDGATAINATFNAPTSIVLDNLDNIFVADTFNHRIRRIDSKTNVITTIAGNGNSNFGVDGVLATNTSIINPSYVAIDKNSNLIIGESGASRIRKVDEKTKIINTIAGNGFLGASGDGGAAIKASLTDIDGLVVDDLNNIYFSDFSSNIVRMIKGSNGDNAGDFSIAFDNNMLNISPGKNGQTTLNITRTGSFMGSVTIMVPDTKAIKVKIVASSLSTTGTTINFNLKAKTKASKSSQQLIFTAKDELGRTRTATLNLTIN